MKILAVLIHCIPILGLLLPQRAAAQQYQWTNFAGLPVGPGYINATGSAARFSSPSEVAVDGSGNVYVADSNNNCIRKVTPGGVVTTFAGSSISASGSADGTGSEALFNGPRGVAVDGSGNVYVADTGNCTIRKISSAGVVTTLAGSPGNAGSTDDTGPNALFSYPGGVAVDGSGNVYVADTNNDTIRKITSAGVVTTLAGSPGNYGSTDGTGNAAQFSFPNGVAVDGSGNVYVADTFNDTIRKVTSTGMVTTFAGTPGVQNNADGTGSVAAFNSPSGVAVDGSGNVYVASQYDYSIRIITTARVVSTVAGTSDFPGSTDGPGSQALFGGGPFSLGPEGVAVDSGGNVYVADTGNNTVRVIAPGAIVSTLAGSPETHGSANGTGIAAQFYSPQGLAVDGSGNVYVADTFNETIRKITSAGAVTTLAGSPNPQSGLPGYAGFANGTGNNAQFWNPVGIAVDGSGNVYVADQYNDLIRKITPAGVVTTLAGSPGIQGSRDGKDAEFGGPTGVAVDTNGNVYVADTGNCTIRKITSAGVVSTLAGSAGNLGSVDGKGSTARFFFPVALAVDSSGNIYVVDDGFFFGPTAIRKITPAGVVTTLPLKGQFSGSQGVAVDGSDNLYVPDENNNVVLKIAPNGAVTTIGGDSGVNGSADGIGPAAGFNVPQGIAIGRTGLLYVADSGSNRITRATSVALQSWTADNITATFNHNPNAASGNRTGVVDSNGLNYYYKATDGNMWRESKNGAQWMQEELTQTANVDDWLAFANGVVYYQGSDYNLWSLSSKGKAWIQAQLTSGGHVAGDVVVETGLNLVCYRNTDGTVWSAYSSGKQWAQASLGGAANVAGDLAVDSTLHIIYYCGTDKLMWVYLGSANSTKWRQMQVGSLAPGSPAAVAAGSTKPLANVGGSVTAAPGGLVYYRSSIDNSPWIVHLVGQNWIQSALDTTASLASAATLHSQQLPVYLEFNGLSTGIVANYAIQYSPLYLDVKGSPQALYLYNGRWTYTPLVFGGNALTGGLTSAPGGGSAFGIDIEGHVIRFYIY